jgi:hypothetical protein
MVIVPLSQRDKRWGAIKLGTSNTTISDFGCTITCIAMIVGTTPDVVNERLKQVQGFAQGNLVIWAKIEQAFTGIKVRRVWTYDNADVKANVKHVLVEVDGKPIGGYRHWVVYVGNQKLYDPWDGQEDPTSDYPNPVSYCVLEGKWEQGQAIPNNEPVVIEQLKAEIEKYKTLYGDEREAKIKLETAVDQAGKINKTLTEENLAQKERLGIISLEKEDLSKALHDLQVQSEEDKKDHEKLQMDYDIMKAQRKDIGKFTSEELRAELKGRSNINFLLKLFL